MINASVGLLSQETSARKSKDTRKEQKGCVIPVVCEVCHEAALVGGGVAAKHAQVPYSQCAVVAAGRQHKCRLRAPGDHIDIRRVRDHRQLRHRFPPGRRTVS